MTTAALIAKAKQYAEKFGQDAMVWVELKCEMLLACERRTTTSTHAAKYRRDLEQFVVKEEAKAK